MTTKKKIKEKEKPGGYNRNERVTLSSIIEDHLTYTDAPCTRLCKELVERSKNEGGKLIIWVCPMCPAYWKNLSRLGAGKHGCSTYADVAHKVASGETLYRYEEAIANALAEIALCLKAQGD